PCSRPCWKTRREFAKPNSAFFINATEMPFAPLPCMVRRNHLSTSDATIPYSDLHRERRSDAHSQPNNRHRPGPPPTSRITSMCQLATPLHRSSSSPVPGQYWPFRCSRTTNWSALSLYTDRRSVPLPTSKLHWSRTLLHRPLSQSKT